MLFNWKVAFETLVICEVESVFWEEMLFYDFRQVCQHHHTQRFLSLNFEVPHLLSSGLYSPMFSSCEKKCPVLWNPGSKDSANHVLTFSSSSINILPNYLHFLNLSHFPVSRNLFLVIWHSDSKTTEYSVLLVFLAKSSLFQDLQ